MSLRETLAGPAGAAWRLVGPLLPRPPGAFRILMFHDVPDSQRAALRRLVERLVAENRLIGPAEAASRLRHGGASPGLPPVLLSFDDGFASNLEVAETILAPLGAHALFFVCPGLMDLSKDEQAAAVSANVLRGLKPAPEPLMDWTAVERLVTLGHTIGNHTSDHLRLTELSADAKAEQIEKAAEALRSRLGETPDWFAYTFGDVDSIDAESLHLIGRHHRYCRSGVRGVNGKGTAPLALRGDHVDLAATPTWRMLAVDGALALAYGEQRQHLDRMVQA
ncbi:polysaccharide deacetylase family protein [Paramagnetospirillum kuznetsovii]|nr:polysaccharide deacetylase family protein [Paramagnetospirillum kuznetsovii]